MFSTGGWTINNKSEVLNIWAFFYFLRLYKKVKTLIKFLKLLCTLPYSKLKTFFKIYHMWTRSTILHFIYAVKKRTNVQ